MHFSRDGHSARESLDNEFKLDPICLKKCGRIDKKLKKGPARVVFDADKMDECHRDPYSQDGYIACLPSVLEGAGKKLVENYLGCCVSCKHENQIYQAGAFNYFGRLLGAFALPKDNAVLLCSFGPDFSQNCFNGPVLNVLGSPGHPIVSSFIHSGGKVVIVSSAANALDMKPEERATDPSFCSMIFYSWEEEEFCASSSSNLTTSQIRLENVTRIGVMVKQMIKNAKITLELHPSSRWWRPKRHADEEELRDGGKKILWFYMARVRKCEAKVSIQSSGLVILGLIFGKEAT